LGFFLGAKDDDKHANSSSSLDFFPRVQKTMTSWDMGLSSSSTVFLLIVHKGTMCHAQILM
jgi:hypothetical protein